MPSSNWILDKNDLESYQETSLIKCMTDYSKSFGNFVTDSDGNHLLDVHGTEYNPIGYNHPELVKAMQTKAYDPYLHNGAINSTATPISDYVRLVDEVMSPLAPQGVPFVTLTAEGNALETAIVCSLGKKAAENGLKQHGLIAFDSCLINGSKFIQTALSGNDHSIGWHTLPYPVAGNEEEILG